MNFNGEDVGHGMNPCLPSAPLPVWWLRLSRPAEPWTLRTRTGRRHTMANSQLQRKRVRGKAQHKEAAPSGSPQRHSWSRSNRNHSDTAGPALTEATKSSEKSNCPPKANKVHHSPYCLFGMSDIRELRALGHWVVSAHKWRQMNQWLLLGAKSCRTLCNPRAAARQAPLSSTISWSLLSSCPLSLWCHPTTSCSAAPVVFCLQSFSASRSFPMRFFKTSHFSGLR